MKKIILPAIIFFFAEVQTLFSQTISISVQTMNGYAVSPKMMGANANLFPGMVAPKGFPCSQCETKYNSACDERSCSGTSCGSDKRQYWGINPSTSDSFTHDVRSLTFQSLYFPEGVHCKYYHYVADSYGFAIDFAEAAALDVWSGDDERRRQYCNEQNYHYGNFYELTVQLCCQTGMHIIISANPYFGTWEELKNMLQYASSNNVSVDAIVFGTEVENDFQKISQTVNGITIPFTTADNYFSHIKSVYLDAMEFDNDYLGNYAAIPIYFSVAGKQPDRVQCDVRTYSRDNHNQNENFWNWKLHNAIQNYTGSLDLHFNGAVNFWWYPVTNTSIANIKKDLYDFLTVNTGIFETAYYDPRERDSCTGYTNLLIDQWGIKRVDQNDNQNTTCDDTFENSFLNQAFLIDGLLYFINHNPANTIIYDGAMFYGLASASDYNPISGNADGWNTNLTSNYAFRELYPAILNSTVAKASINFSADHTNYMDAFYAYSENNHKLFLVNYSDTDYTLNGLLVDNTSMSGNVSYTQTKVNSGGNILSKINNMTEDQQLNGDLSSITVPKLSITIIDVCTNLSASISASGSTSICEGASVTLSEVSGSGNSYQWNNDVSAIAGATAAAYLATISGNYTCRITNFSGCSQTSNTISIVVNPLPAPHITASGPKTFCQGGSVTLNEVSGSGNSYQWKKNGTAVSGATTSSYSANVSGSYKCRIKNSLGCSQTSNAISVTVNPLPVVSVAPLNATVCNNSSVLLTASGADSYSWSPNSLTGSSVIVSPPGNTTTTFTVTGTTGGCSAEATASITTSTDKSFFSIATNKTGTCSGGYTLMITPSPSYVSNYTYQWQSSITSGAGPYSNISGATNSSYVPVTSGTATWFRCKVTTGTCTKNSWIMFVGAGCHRSSGDEKPVFDLEVFPNPFDNYFTVRFNPSSGELIDVMLVDIRGRILKRYFGIEPSAELHIPEDLAPGVYLLKVRQGKDQLIRKVVRIE